MRKMTGATLPVVADDHRVTGPRILVGESAATRALGLRSSGFKAQEYLVRISTNTMVLLGRDAAPGPGKTSASTFTWADGKFGKALSFNGKDDYYSVGDCGFRDEAGSMECWVWLPAAPQDKESTLLRLDGSGPWTYHILRRWPGTSELGYTVYDGTNGFNVSSKPLAEGWHHVLCTHDEAAGKMELFVDGISQGTAQFTHTTCRGALLMIGGISGATVGNPLRAVVDEVRISTVVRAPKTDGAGGPYTPDAATACLFHFDEGRGEPRESTGHVRILSTPDLFEEKGSLTAVYDFLERFCGVRWYAPGDVGIVCPSKPTLTVRPAEIRRAPAMRHRWITPTSLFMPTPKDPISTVDVALWKLRMRIGGEPFWACHSFGGYYDRFLKTHPDWFAQGYTGQPPQMCYTSPGFIQQVIQDANDYFDGKGMPPGGQGMGDYFSLVPMDTAGWCKAPPCPELLDSAEAKNPQFSNGHASNYIWGFVNKVAAEVRKTHPDKWIAALAYWEYAYYPDKVKLEPNITVQMCLHTRNWWCPSMEANDRKILHDWRAADPNRPLYLWLYYCFPALNATSGNYNCFPGFFAHTVVRQMKMYHDAHIQGIFLEHSSEMGLPYLFDQLEFYVTFKLADDQTLDGDKLIDEFFTLYYGAAAAPMKRLYLGIEDAYSNPRSYPVEIQKSPAHNHQNEALAWGSVGTEERMARFAVLMDQARAAAKTDLEKQRVGLFEKGVWDYMVEGRRKYLERSKVQAVPPPSVTVPRVADAAGDPARVDWSKALVLDKWSSLAGDATDRKLSGRLAHDGSFLYVELTDASVTGALASAADIWGRRRLGGLPRSSAREALSPVLHLTRRQDRRPLLGRGPGRLGEGLRLRVGHCIPYAVDRPHGLPAGDAALRWREAGGEALRQPLPPDGEPARVLRLEPDLQRRLPGNRPPRRTHSRMTTGGHRCAAHLFLPFCPWSWRLQPSRHPSIGYGSAPCLSSRAALSAPTSSPR